MSTLKVNTISPNSGNKVTITNQLTASNGLKIDAGNLVVDENATVTGQLSASNGIAVTGDATFSQKVTVTGDLTASNGLKVDVGNLVVDETAEIAGHITGSNGLSITGDASFSQNVTVTGDLSVNGTVTLGDSISVDVTTATSEFTASAGVLIPDDMKLKFGTNADATIEYDEDDSNKLIIAGAAVQVSSSLSSSNGFDFTNHIAGNNGVVTVSGQLTASNGMKVDAGNLVVDENATITGQLSASSLEIANKIEADDGGFGGDLGVSGTISTAHVSASQGIEVTGSLKLGASDNTTGYLELSYIDHASIPTGDEDRVLLYVSGSGTNAKIYAKAGSNTQTNVGGADIANDVNNRVTTADGSGGLNGEANLTFDGSTLTITGFASTLAVGNASTISEDVSVPENYNSILYGPITISSGKSLTIGASSNVKIRDISDA
jgi:predicted acyltransferase (DUF342 family)